MGITSVPSPHEPDRPLWMGPRISRRGAGLLLASRILRGLAAGLITIGFPYLVLTELHSGAVELGEIYAGGALSTALITYGFGRFGSRSGLRGTYLASLGLLPVACVLLLLPPSLPLAAVASVLGGFSATGSLAGGGVGGAAMPLQTAILSDLTPPEKRTLWFSRFTFLAGLSAALGTMAGGFGGLEAVFVAALVLSGASFFAALAIPVRRVERGRRPSSRSRGVIWRFTATGVLNGLSQGVLAPFLIPFFVLYFGIARPEMAIYTTASGVVGTLAVLAAPLLEARWGFVQALVGTRAVAAALSILLPFVPLAAALGMYVALPAFRVAALPAQQSALVNRLPHADRSEGSGTNQAARLAAAGAATAVGGFALEDVAAAVPFVGSAVLLLSNSYLYVRFFGWHGDRIPSRSEAST